MTTAQDVADWMVAEVEVQGFLYQSKAVNHIAEHFGEEFTYRNEAGSLAIAAPVLQAFHELTKDTVFWDRWTKAWRLRAKTS